MSNLYINIGNTNTSFAVSISNNIEELNVIKKETSIFKKNNFKKNLEEVIEQFNSKINFVYISSVVPSINYKFENFFKKRRIVFLFMSHNEIPYLDLTNLKNPSELGSDILAQSCYINRFFEEVMVVSLGTASIIYHMKDNKFTGCLILPGIKNSINSIKDSTEIEEFKIIDTDQILGTNTNEAISIGIINTIENTVESIMKKLDTNCPIICTGGNASFLLKNKWWFIDNLEIMGLFFFAQNFSQKEEEEIVFN